MIKARWQTWGRKKEKSDEEQLQTGPQSLCLDATSEGISWVRRDDGGVSYFKETTGGIYGLRPGELSQQLSC